MNKAIENAMVVVTDYSFPDLSTEQTLLQGAGCRVTGRQCKTEAELIDSFIERRMGSIAAGGPIEDERKLAAAYRKLRRAGFSSGPILAALKRIAARPETLEEPPAEESEEECQ